VVVFAFIVVSRLIEQWNPMYLYFQDKHLTERLTIAETIRVYSALTDPLIKLIFLFLDWILPKFTSVNSFFQSSSVAITQLHDKMVSTHTDLLLIFMKQDYVNKTPLHLINPENVEQYNTKYKNIPWYKSIEEN